MKRLLIRADDLGYSYAVNLGIVRTVREGLVRSVGVMPNMPEAERGLSWLRETGTDVALGQHTNVCLGTPCADPARIPSLVDECGSFRSSRAYRDAAARGEDFVNFDEAIIEIEAQHERFVELAGAEPDYFEAHAVQSANLMAAISHVALSWGLREQPLPVSPRDTVTCGSTAVRMLLEDMLPPERYDPVDFIRRSVKGMADGETCVLVFHPGYLDGFILANSSLTVNRAREVDALIDPALRVWLDEQDDLLLVDYRSL